MISERRSTLAAELVLKDLKQNSSELAVGKENYSRTLQEIIDNSIELGDEKVKTIK
jgi:hypothetical protein